MSLILTYTQQITSEYKSGIAREHAYRPALKTLIEALESDLQAVNDPKHSEGGAPDFIVLRGIIPIAFVETKDITAKLDKTAKTDQLDRYREAYGNLILTNYLEFRWYLDGECVETVTIGEKTRNGLTFNPDKFADLESLLNRFIHAVVPTVTSAEQLARKMAGLAHDIANLITLYLADDKTNTALQSQKLIFQQELLPQLTDPQFADMYAQTLAYGLFAARVGYTGKPEDFNIRQAFWELPKTNPFLKTLFQSISTDLDERVQRWADTIAQLLARTDMDDILANFGRRTKQTDPVIHFYETFLAAYDPKTRERRGVYYTPEPVVSYIVRSVDSILQTQFNKAGLQDKDVLILDPATGTGTFLYFVIQHIYEQLVEIGGQGGRWSAYVGDNLLRRVFGFELLMAPYTIAHMKLQILLREQGYDFKPDERLGVYLTNALEPANPQQQELRVGLKAALSEEADGSNTVKKDQPIMVVLGNPPYSGHSSNENDWIDSLLDGYYYVDGKRLQERNSKWIRNDYVKFIRMGQDRIQRTGHGILAFVTSHSFLDGPIFRGMRQSLMQTFSDIYILDLHGNSNKKEVSPNGTPDENVFEITEGVSVGIFIKNPDAMSKNGVARVHHAHLFGRRKEKYDVLNTTDITNTEWKLLKPSAPFHLFIPQNGVLKTEYERGWKITDVMPTNGVGITTARDHLNIHYTQQELTNTMSQFSKLPVEQARTKFDLRDDVRDWKVSWAQNDLREHTPMASYVQPIMYRPFDIRHTLYTGTTKGLHCMPRQAIMQHMINQKNTALITCRGYEITFFEHVFITSNLLSLHGMSLKESNYLFPLYLYKQNGKMDLLGDDEFPFDDDGKRPNFSVKFIRQLEKTIDATFMTDFTPESVFHYMYAVFHAPVYRARYTEFLKIDYPRLPLPPDKPTYDALVALGEELANIHLMQTSILHKHGVTFPVSGDDTVASRHPKYKDGAVYINKTQYFGNINEEEWEFTVGGYQVLEKWLKDRKSRKLSDDDMTHYQRVVKAIRETIRLMGEIDEAMFI